MIIEDLIKHSDDPETFLYLERHVNSGSRTYSSFAAQSEGQPEYQPSSQVNSFEVPCLKIPKEKVSIYLDNPNTELLKYYIHNDTVLFPVHPEIFQDDKTAFIEELRKYPSESIRVSPTASTRTVMTKMEDIPHHFIKLHYPRRISRFIRRLRCNNIQNSIEVSKDLRCLTLPKFAYLPETIGICYGSGPESWGFIIREYTPRPVTKNKILIPMFALYAQDDKNVSDPPLLIQLIQYLNKDPATFVLSHIMQPIIEMWCTVLRSRGILFEAHGQNTLLELNSEGNPIRIIYRDLDVYVDPEIRKHHKLHISFPNSHFINGGRSSIYSLKYDAFMGHHLFDYLASLLESFYKINPTALQEACKETFNHNFPDADLCFTNKTFYYSDKILLNNKCEIIETNDPPKWR